MRILIVHNRYRHAGGEDVVFSAEANLLSQRGHAVRTLVVDNTSIRGLGHLSAAANTVWSRAGHALLARALKGERFDVVHFHNTLPLISPSAYYACKEAGVPVVQTVHNYRLLCPAATFYREGRVCEDCMGRGFWPAVLQGCYRSSRMATAVVATMLATHRVLRTWTRMVDVYIALTAFARRKLTEGGIPEAKIVVKPNFVDPDPGVGDHTGGYALFVGRLSPEKGIATLLSAWSRLGSTIPLKIVGSGPLEVLLRQPLRNVEWVGHRTRTEVIALMKAASFLVFPSEWHESFGLVVAEAFATGLPVIGARLGAAAELVEDGHTGLHFSPGDPDDLAAKVSWAFAHPSDLLTMGRRARAVFENQYTSEANYQRLMEIYRAARGAV